MDYVAIAIEGRARIQDHMPSAILNIAPETLDSSTATLSSGDDAQVSDSLR